ncbi:MAG: ABC transporter permease, partial [Clostridia bacterium]|nr:ABC transporter permease [Clostridia bacterium]
MKRLTVNTFALQSLKKRKKQYAALIAGIILAMVFSSGTLFFVSCLSSSQKEIRRRDFGTADRIAFELTEENFRQLVGQNPGVEYGLAHMLGFAYTEEPEEGAAVGWLDETAKEYYQPVVLEGRWPEAECEVAVEQDALLRMGLADAKPGDVLTVNLFAQNGPGARSETPIKKRYTLVGLLGDKRKNLTLSYPDANQYLPALLVSDKELVELGGKEALTAYIRTPPKYDLKLDAAVMSVNESAAWRALENLTGQTVYSSILSGVLMLASGLGIVNAFNADLHERKHQIGLLRAVGATKRQIVGIYGRETLVLACVCAPVSLCLSYFGVKIITGFMEDFIFLPSWWVLLGSMAASLLFVLLASLIPLTAAARVSPMQAIRNT